VAATEKGRAAGLSGRIYNEFIWGGYLLKEWPEQKVFIDGQTDFYGEDIMRQYTRIGMLWPGWRDLMAKWNIELVLVPSTAGLAHELVRDPMWSIWHCDSTAVLLQRRPKPDSTRSPAEAEADLFGCAPVK
jgi:hypothetical protein